MWLPLNLRHRYSVLRVHLGGYFLSWVCSFGWKSILLDNRMATPICFLGPFAWEIFSSLLLQIVSVFVADVYFPVCSKMLEATCIYSLLAIVFFIGELNQMILRDLRDQWLLLPVIFIVRGGIMFVCFSSFGFVVRRLISWFSLVVVFILVLEFSSYYPL